MERGAKNGALDLRENFACGSRRRYDGLVPVPSMEMGMAGIEPEYKEMLNRMRVITNCFLRYLGKILILGRKNDTRSPRPDSDRISMAWVISDISTR
ncbi:hypothetical protein PAAG_01428 [Paracoccidioides lutzii Pb01]|uniref:Uncharacterized protein n=1 Tax=Paracoccidioides lutzii (strain ATCC MYA-826 / Pb01) TaxID=502779 RepID=C1GSD3_PARBA|nr:hypothetical protein PAAG_01428 [Paracoccidioides lutzii Pb01]EEH38966.2 hypothetical protein PAAG_01428 [Paracoccidioides lutzii Pb01]